MYSIKSIIASCREVREEAATAERVAFLFKYSLSVLSSYVTLMTLERHNEEQELVLNYCKITRIYHEEVSHKVRANLSKELKSLTWYLESLSHIHVEELSINHLTVSEKREADVLSCNFKSLDKPSNDDPDRIPDPIPNY